MLEDKLLGTEVDITEEAVADIEADAEALTNEVAPAAKDKEASKRCSIKTSLNQPQYEDFCKLAKSLNKKQSTVLRELVLKELNSKGNGQLKQGIKRPDYKTEELTSVNIRLTKEEIDSIDAVADTYDLSRNKALILIIRTSLLHTVMFPQEDRDALFAVCRELKKIGVNINQIARELNTFNKHRLVDSKEGLETEIEILKILTKDKSVTTLIDESIQKVADFINKGSERVRKG